MAVGVAPADGIEQSGNDATGRSALGPQCQLVFVTQFGAGIDIAGVQLHVFVKRLIRDGVNRAAGGQQDAFAALLCTGIENGLQAQDIDLHSQPGIGFTTGDVMQRRQVNQRIRLELAQCLFNALGVTYVAKESGEARASLRHGQPDRQVVENGDLGLW